MGECYHVVVCNIEDLLKNMLSEGELIEEIFNLLKARIEMGLSFYQESASKDIIRNAINSIRQMNLIELSVNDCTLFVCNVTSKKQIISDIVVLLDKCQSINILLKQV